MIDDERVAQWAKEASIVLMRNLDKNEEIAHFASIILALNTDREERERYISREAVINQPRPTRHGSRGCIE